MGYANTLSEPFPNWKFKVVLDGIEKAGFTKVSGLEADTDMIEYREGEDPSTPFKVAGQTKYSDITLERGQVNDLEAFAAFSVVFDKVSGLGSSDYKAEDCVIQQFDRTGVLVREWAIDQAWVKTWKLGDMDASTSELMIESIVLCHEGVAVNT